MQERCLYVGGDDSNHAGDSQGEIIVATFSYSILDYIHKKFSSRSREKLKTWIDLPRNDFRLGILQAEQYRHSGQNLGCTIPELLHAYLRSRENMLPNEIGR